MKANPLGQPLTKRKEGESTIATSSNILTISKIPQGKFSGIPKLLRGYNREGNYDGDTKTE
jgi:hypothetical protein